jgi:hypothetical protein
MALEYKPLDMPHVPLDGNECPELPDEPFESPQRGKGLSLM